jgi:hypothetical protein
MNKKIKALSWTPEELKVIKKYAGKLPINEIVILVNKVSTVVRTENAVAGAGRKNGFKFGLAA